MAAGVENKLAALGKQSQQLRGEEGGAAGGAGDVDEGGAGGGGGRDAAIELWVPGEAGS